MTPNTLISEDLAIVGIIDPDANAAGTYLTSAIDMSKWESIAAIVMAGTLGSSATVDFKFTDSATSGGSYADITGKAITQLTDAGTDSDKQAIVNLRSTELNSGKRYVKGSLTVATATSDCGVVIVGRPRIGPANLNDLASVDEIVN